jgi:hypothetical protein
MPRSSPFLIHLSAAEATELRRRSAKYTLPYFQVQRAKMILMAAEGLENSEIALWVRGTLASGSPPDFFPLIWSCR